MHSYLGLTGLEFMAIFIAFLNVFMALMVVALMHMVKKLYLEVNNDNK